MYADRYRGMGGVNPYSLTASLTIIGSLLAAFYFAAPTVRQHIDERIHTFFIPVEPPPPKPQPKPHRLKPAPAPQPDQPRQRVETRIDTHFDFPKLPPQPPVDDTAGIGTTTTLPPPPLPPLIDARVDPRYAGDLQPPYPPAERRANHEGRVVVRVLIGVDGRVKQLERISADSDAFFEATRRQALAKWRFRPATRGGVPEESWQTKSVRFVLEDD